MLTGLAGGALWALDTVILGMALALPVFTGDPRAAILAPFASTFLHDLCSSLWMLGYTGLRRQYKAVWQALHTRGGRLRKASKIGKIKQPMSAKNGHTKTKGGFQYARFISFNAGDEPIL